MASGTLEGRSFTVQVILLQLFCRGERLERYHLRNRSYYVKKDLALAVKWLLACGIDIDGF